MMKISLSKMAGLLAAFLSGMLIVLIVPAHGKPAWSPDSIYYWLCSQSIASGHGFSLPNADLFHFAYVPFTGWPPLFPLFLASGSPPLVLQALIMGFVTLLVFSLLKDASALSPVVVWAVSLICMFSWPILMDASYVWSEPLMLSWVFSALATLYLTATGKITPLMGWSLAVIALSLAFYTRYAALTFIPGAMLIFMIAPCSVRKRLLYALTMPLAIGLLISPLLLRNWLLTGHISGTLRPLSHKAPENLLLSTLDYVGWVFASSGWMLVLYVFFALGAIGAAVVFVLEKRKVVQTSHQDLRVDKIRTLALASSALCVSYLAMIMILRAWKHFDFSTRMLSPAMPFLLLSITSWGLYILRSANGGWQRYVLALPFAGLLLLSAVNGSAMGYAAHSRWLVDGSPLWPMNRIYKYANHAPGRFPPIKGIILTDRPRIMGFYTGWDMRRVSARPWTKSRLERIIQHTSGILIYGPKSTALANAVSRLVSGEYIPLGAAELFLWKMPHPNQKDRK